ncbi:MAG: hypothetical protein WAT94_00755 [Enterococcus aquimarinus]
MDCQISQFIAQYRTFIYFLPQGKIIGTLFVYSSHEAYFSMFFSSSGVETFINTVVINTGDLTLHTTKVVGFLGSTP